MYGGASLLTHVHTTLTHVHVAFPPSQRYLKLSKKRLEGCFCMITNLPIASASAVVVERTSLWLGLTNTWVVQGEVGGGVRGCGGGPVLQGRG